MSETKITRMLCQGCGADLDVSDDVRFVKCDYCSAKLEVVRDESTVRTRVLETIADDVKIIQAVRMNWSSSTVSGKQRKEDFMVSDKNGNRSIPTRGGSMVAGGVAILVFGIFWIAMASNIGSKVGGAGFALSIVSSLAIHNFWHLSSHEGSSQRRTVLSRLKASIEKRRAELLRKLGDS